MMSDEEAEQGFCEDCADPKDCSECGEPTDPQGFVDGTVCWRCRLSCEHCGADVHQNDTHCPRCEKRLR